MERLRKLGIGGGTGFLLGIALVLWVQPTTTGGTVALVAVPAVAGMVVGEIVAFLRRRSSD